MPLEDSPREFTLYKLDSGEEDYEEAVKLLDQSGLKYSTSKESCSYVVRDEEPVLDIYLPGMDMHICRKGSREIEQALSNIELRDNEHVKDL